MGEKKKKKRHNRNIVGNNEITCAIGYSLFKEVHEIKSNPEPSKVFKYI